MQNIEISTLSALQPKAPHRNMHRETMMPELQSSSPARTSWACVSAPRGSVVQKAAAWRCPYRAPHWFLHSGTHTSMAL